MPLQYSESQYPESAYTDQSPNISPPNGLISPRPGGPGPYYQVPTQYSYTDPNSGASSSANYGGSPASQSDDNQAKRARNTAASARFRAKKKEREQELERNSKRTKDTVTKLEAKVVQLETENRWLKDLVTGKIQEPKEEGSGGGKGGRERSEEVVGEWESHKHTDGAGTKRSGRKK